MALAKFMLTTVVSVLITMVIPTFGDDDASGVVDTRSGNVEYDNYDNSDESNFDGLGDEAPDGR
eukprot:6060984-Lingulodinium_polyedra.AAC.1